MPLILADISYCNVLFTSINQDKTYTLATIVFDHDLVYLYTYVCIYISTHDFIYFVWAKHLILYFQTSKLI